MNKAIKSLRWPIWQLLKYQKKDCEEDNLELKISANVIKLAWSRCLLNNKSAVFCSSNKLSKLQWHPIVCIINKRKYLHNIFSPGRLSYNNPILLNFSAKLHYPINFQGESSHGSWWLILSLRKKLIIHTKSPKF